MISTIFILLFLYQIKHFLCDYIFQGKYMLGKFNKVGWELPLTAHAGTHFLGTLLIGLFFSTVPVALFCAVLDFAIHFVVDKCKVEASRTTNTSEAKFWWYLGIDQMAHHLTHYVIIAILVLL